MSITTTLGISPDKVASIALEHYHSVLPNHGKPQSETEWTVYAALVISFNNNDNTTTNTQEEPFVVSSATGSKCCTLPTSGGTTTTNGMGQQQQQQQHQHAEAYCLQDLHAEVLVKRGFQRVLWKEISSSNNNSRKLCILEKKNGKYSLRSDASLHLYISDSPCGDASIYQLSNDEMNFTGAKLIVDNHNNGPTTTTSNASKDDDDDVADGTIVGHEALPCVHGGCQTIRREPSEQHLGQLRIKSGRSNLAAEQRCTSLSCSDKLLRWNLLGLEGSSLTRFIERPIRLTSVIVSRDPNASSSRKQQEALYRSLAQRTDSVLLDLLNNKQKGGDSFVADLKSHTLRVHIVDQVYANAKSQVIDVTSVPSSNITTTSSERNENGKRDIESVPSSNRKPRKRTFACGYSLNWQYTVEAPLSSSSSAAEVLIGARGCKQCTKKNRHDFDKIASRLSRMSMYQLSKEADAAASPNTSYRQWKQTAFNATRSKWKQTVLETSPMQAWIKSSRDFDLSKSSDST